MQRSRTHQTFVYALLVCGAIVFLAPYVWMIGSSVKVDREQFTKDLRFLPMTPTPRVKSPYIDDRFFDLGASVGRAKRDELAPGVRQLVEATNPTIPADVDRDAALTQITHGVIERLRSRLPDDVWDSSTDRVLAEARSAVQPQIVKESFDQVHRRLDVGAIRVRDAGVELYELGTDKTPSQRWNISGPATVTAHDIVDGSKHAAQLDYDFSTGPSFTLSQTFDLPFDASTLQRLTIDLHPDDTWHNVRLTLEHNGRKYVARSDLNLSNFDWLTATWQHASSDDNSTKLRQWVVLDDAGPSDVTAPRQARVSVEFRQASQATAWANKIKDNYVKTGQQIPIWRYIRVSLFLVAANIVLTVLSSSLVAYAFARIEWPGRNFAFLLMLATMMIPSQVTMIPSFLIWTGLGAYDTLAPLWVGAAFGNAFFIFMMRQFMAGIPRDLEDAARIDGCGFLRIYWHVIVPLIKPSLAAIAVMTFVSQWNDFMGPLIYIADQRLYPLAFGLYAFSVQVQNNPALSMAGSVLMTLPIIAIFFAAQRYFIQGITLTGMKG